MRWSSYFLSFIFTKILNVFPDSILFVVTVINLDSNLQILYIDINNNLGKLF